MNRKKFFKTISTSVIGLAFWKMNPTRFFKTESDLSTKNKIKVKLNPFAVDRQKTGKKNG